MAKFKVGDLVKDVGAPGPARRVLAVYTDSEGIYSAYDVDVEGYARRWSESGLCLIADKQKLSLLDEVKPILEDRQAQYGDARPDFERIAKLWSALVGVEIKVEQVPLMMQALKLSRAWTHYKRDNQVDIVGYGVKYEEVANN